jgi:homoserine kinase
MHPIRLKLPATSANLGPGFDAVGLAIALYLTIDAAVSDTQGFTIEAVGRNADLCSRLENNLILETYRDVLAGAGLPIVPLHLKIDNQIPLGMGCGSSAAALLGGVLLANHFGALSLDLQACMEEACRREGHPDNVAACAFGYMTVSTDVSADAVTSDEAESSIITATCGQALHWKLLLALPSASLATEKARALLPDQYSRADAVANVQRTALLVSAFALGRGDLLRTAMQDRLHQPYRLAACPLLGHLLPLTSGPAASEILGVALSGAGPGVLIILAPDAPVEIDIARIRRSAADESLEVIETKIAAGTSTEEFTA